MALVPTKGVNAVLRWKSGLGLKLITQRQTLPAYKKCGAILLLPSYSLNSFTGTKKFLFLYFGFSYQYHSSTGICGGKK
jgi:hypothetical protein